MDEWSWARPVMGGQGIPKREHSTCKAKEEGRHVLCSYVQPLTGSKLCFYTKGSSRPLSGHPGFFIIRQVTPCCWGPCLSGPHDFVSVQGFGAQGTWGPQKVEG